MAMYGWENAKQTANYTRAADRKRLAGDAMRLIDLNETSEEQISPTDKDGFSHC